MLDVLFLIAFHAVVYGAAFFTGVAVERMRRKRP
jgi:hypothetical protein